jgi:hypothetical protein
MRLHLNTTRANIVDYIQFAICLLFLLSLYFYFIFRYPFAFNFETDNNGQYLAAFLGISVFTVLIVISSRVKIFNRGFYFNCSVIAILFTVMTCTRKYSISNEYYVTAVVAFLIYFFFRLINLTGSSILLYFLAAVFIWQLCVALVQLNGVESSINPLSIKGTLRNSGIFSCYLVVQLPFLFYLFFKKKKKISNREISFEKEFIDISQRRRVIKQFITTGRRVLFFVIILFVLFIIYKTKSRTAFIAITITSISMLWFYMQANLKQSSKILNFSLLNGKKLAGVIICIFVPFILYIGYYLFQVKKLSAFGRIMKWEITMQHIDENFLLGEGLGRFTWHYPNWQAAYFASNSQPPQEFFLSAGESYIIFNEYLQLFKSVGLLGFVLFLICLFYYFTSKSSKYKDELNASKTTVIAILSCGFTSYPLHVTSFLFLLAFCFAYAANVHDSHPFFKKPFHVLQRAKGFFFILLVLLSFYTATVSVKSLIAKYEWDSLREKSFIPRMEAKKRYLALYKILGQDGKFLSEYGEFLSQNSVDCVEAVKVLEKAKLYFLSRKTVETTAYAYRQIKNYSKAIENFEWLSNFLPNRFIPKFELFKTYIQIGDGHKAEKLADVILNMPVKIPSETVEEIKEDVHKWNENYKFRTR